MEQDADYEHPENKPSQEWPAQGAIEFKDVEMSYRPELPTVLFEGVDNERTRGREDWDCGQVCVVTIVYPRTQLVLNLYFENGCREIIYHDSSVPTCGAEGRFHSH